MAKWLRLPRSFPAPRRLFLPLAVRVPKRLDGPLADTNDEDDVIDDAADEDDCYTPFDLLVRLIQMPGRGDPDPRDLDDPN